MPRQLLGTAIASNTITTTQLQTTIVNNITQGGGPRVTSLVYPGNDTAANTVGGQTVYVNGSGFAANAAVYINGSAVPSLAFISASNLQITTPVLSSATYPVYVINPETGATAILIPGLIVSGEPTWVTSAGSLSASQDELSAWSYNLSATGDAPITYALAAGNTLPSGISLASNGAISGTLSSPAGNTTTYTFSVVASDAQNQDSTRQFTVTTSTAEGVLFANNVLLIHADGTNNKNNHHFLDSSNNNFTITRYGNSTQGSFSPFSQTGWSGYFDGTGDNLTLASNAAFGMGTSNFTIECWIYMTAAQAARHITDSGTSSGLFLKLNSTTVGIGRAGVGEDNMFTYSFNQNAWYHIAFSRSGSTVYGFVNGVLIGTGSNSINYATGGLYIGTDSGSGQAYQGYISNFRLVKGTAVYTSAFTPPTAPLTAIANTSLLTCQDNNFIDKGPNNFAITRAGHTSIQPYSPFAPGLLSSNSHSVYFDGTGDYLSVADNIALDAFTDFTIEGWVYFNSVADNQCIATKGWDASSTLAPYIIYTAGGNLVFSSSTDGSSWAILNQSIIPSISTGRWYHFAVTRSGSTVRYFNDGALTGTSTVSAALMDSSYALTVGSHRTGGYNLNGYLSNFRVVKGTAVYTSAFTPPTSALTAITNTSLLACQSARLIDNSTNAFTITAYGNAQPRTYNPFGQTYTSSAYTTANVGGSGYFDGSGDYLTYPADSSFWNDTSFTMEFWAYCTKASGITTVLASWTDSNMSAGSWGAEVSAGNTFTLSNGGSSTTNQSAWLQGTTNVRNNGWHHFCVTKSAGNAYRLFTDGKFEAYRNESFTTTNNNVSIKVGYQGDGTYDPGSRIYSGWISGIRIIRNSVPAEYQTSLTTPGTQVFIPPTAPPTNVTNTTILMNFTNAGIFDQTAKNVLETVGDAKVSTAQYKYGTGSMSFDGNGDYIKMTKNATLLDFGTGDFTLETWVRFNTVGADQAILGSDGTTGAYDILYRTGIGLVIGRYNTAFDNNFSWSPSINTWYHIAWCRSGSSLRAFVDGVQIGSTATNSTAYNGGTNYSVIGASDAGSNRLLNGFLDDLRITKGYARYTSNFTAPTSALKDK